MTRSIYILLAILGVAVLITVWLPLPSPESGKSLLSPSWIAWLGTDALGRDVLYRTYLGFGYTLLQATFVLLISLVFGAFAAIVSALWFERWPDRVIVLAAESLRSYPALLLVLLFAAAGASPVILLIVYFWMPIWRTLRFELTSQQREPYALWMRLLGMSRFHVLLREVFPNVLPRSVPYTTALLSEIIAAQAAIEFLGFGPRIEQPSLGGILLEAGQVGFGASWVWLPSLFMLVVTILGVAWAVRQYRQAIRWVPIG